MPGGTSSERGSIRVTGVPGRPRTARRRYASACCQPRNGSSTDGDRAQPLHVRHPVPAGHDQAQRIAVLRRQRLAVHRVGEQHLVAQRIVEREAALVDMLDAALDAAVERR